MGLVKEYLMQVYYDSLHENVISLSRSKLPEIPADRASNIFKKFSAFETDVIEKLSKTLCEVDKDSSVLVTGSYRSNPDNLRQTSDIDMILFSSALRSPDTYVNFLSNVKTLSDDFTRSSNLTPIFFTTVAAENNFIYMARKQNSQEGIVPVHVLYYKDQNELFHLEPAGLATRLLTSAKVIQGKDQYSIKSNGAQITPLEKIRWDLERSIAELILNEGSIEKEWLYSNFNNSVYISIRGQTDNLGLEGSNAKSVLDYFDPSGDLMKKFGIHFVLRNNMNLASAMIKEELLEGPHAFLKILQERIV